ncbi:MAG: bifunctional phosphoribosyl-AMP cyclohydrolase/phosphoribosyl-ATP diphosphatase HisIE [Fusobacteria bacterium]|nr:bifunctional phosphoribosyl-AMP cyclohydrolase/phosphoribosyl-ATP diphosphatase HisIE [Fusobacteriota bacterium]
MLNIKKIRFNSDGLVPVIVQDYKDNEVLMLAYMNEEAFNKTMETGKATYFSRSRNSLWLKGETSGHFQNVKEIYYDCDEDTILLKIEQVGNIACHTGERSCFYRKIKEFEKIEPNIDILEKLYETIIERKNNPINGSYTNYLFDKGVDKILKKVGEECSEVIIGAKNDNNELVYEISDLIYHLLVLMAAFNIEPKIIKDELIGRENKKHEKDYSKK